MLVNDYISNALKKTTIPWIPDVCCCQRSPSLHVFIIVIIGTISETGSPYCFAWADKIWNHDQLCTTYIHPFIVWIEFHSDFALGSECWHVCRRSGSAAISRKCFHLYEQKRICACVCACARACVCACVCVSGWGWVVVLCINTPTDWKKAEHNLLVLHHDSHLYLKVVIIE